MRSGCRVKNVLQEFIARYITAFHLPLNTGLKFCALVVSGHTFTFENIKLSNPFFEKSIKSAVDTINVLLHS